MTLPGLMQRTPLTVHSIFERMRSVHADRRIWSVDHATTYGAVAERVLKLMTVLRDLGVGPGDRVASYAFNSARHLELYFAVPMLGAVLHTVNVRLYREQIVYIVRHAQDAICFYDPELEGTVGDLRGDLPGVREWIATGPEDHDERIAAAAPASDVPQVDEDAACGLCYTSGTTGMPKGVLMSHRATWLHALSILAADHVGIRERDVVLPVVPMFHAFGWGMPYAAPFCGASLVLHGSDSSAENLYRLVRQEGVTVMAGVPTIWKDLYPVVEREGPATLRTLACGGSAPPRVLIDRYDRLGVELLQLWGMTETGPVAAASRPRAHHAGIDRNDEMDVRAKTGTIFAGLEARIVGDDDEPAPQDGKTVGELEVRGPWIAAAYFKGEGPDRFHDGWLRTGDMATMDPDGYIRIVDRSKDLVKSGGEWISSVELEGLILAHPQVLDAAVVGCRSVKWDERPVAVVVAAGQPPTLESVREFLADKVAKWWLPDELVVVDEIPKTSVGKIDKKVLRAQLDHIELP